MKCDFECFDETSLNSHTEESHDHNEVYECNSGIDNSCDFRSNNKDVVLNQIKEKHSSNKPFSCGKCEFECIDQKSLNLHMEQCHSYRCNKCQFIAENGTTLERHVASLHTEQVEPNHSITLSCENCGYQCDSVLDLENHKKSQHPVSFECIQTCKVAKNK